jgi:ADP-ribosyl-[dinitrogen reductase] hydrolase
VTPALRSIAIRDRIVGSVLGLALGDALGAPFEFRRRGDIPDPLPAFELPWMGRPPGTTTDDTAMAMNLVTSLGHRGGFDADDLIERHMAWFRADPPDVGNLTRRVLRGAADAGGGAAAATDLARRIWEERGPEVSAGNGSVMYCAPLGVAYAHRPAMLIELAPALSALTHADPRCRTACLAVTLTVAALVRGERAERAVTESVVAVQDRDGGEELEFLIEAVGMARPIDGPDQGFCLFAAAAGLQALLRGGSYQRELTEVVRLGGDTDTNAAVAGALIGARDGPAGLPRTWFERLQGRDAIGPLAERLTPLALTLPG